MGSELFSKQFLWAYPFVTGIHSIEYFMQESRPKDLLSSSERFAAKLSLIHSRGVTSPSRANHTEIFLHPRQDRDAKEAEG